MSKKSFSLQESVTLVRHKEFMLKLYDRINNFHKRPLHQGQIKISKALFNQHKRVIQAQFGRSCGKTEAILFITWVYANLNDNSQILIVTPQRKQGKDIYWASGRITNYGPQEYVTQHKESELRVMFDNGSIITIDGCENYEALRGIKPNLVCYDEFQHHSKEFDVEVMQPNLVAKAASLIVMGTPPKRDCYYCEFRERLMEEIEDGDNTRLYLELPSSCNPALDKAELEKTKARLFKQGDQNVWYREYEGKLIFGGEDAVFPTWDRRVHIRPHSLIMKAIEKDRHKMRWYTIFDPGTTTVFAILFAAYNPYTSQMFILDEIYESDRKFTDTFTMWHRAMEKEKELFSDAQPRTWIRVYDEAAAWFAREVQSNYRETLTPTDKKHNKKEDVISILKGMLAEDSAFIVSDRLAKLPWEIENFVTDDKGRLPDDHDHLLDCVCYLLVHSGFKFVEKADPQRLIITDATVGRFHKFTHNQPLEGWADTVTETSLEGDFDDYFYDA